MVVHNFADWDWFEGQSNYLKVFPLTLIFSPKGRGDSSLRPAPFGLGLRIERDMVINASVLSP